MKFSVLTCRTLGLLSFLLLVACGESEAPGSAQTAPQPQSTAQTATFAPASFGNITFERLLNADSEPGQWLTEGRDFGKGHRAFVFVEHLDH